MPGYVLVRSFDNVNLINEVDNESSLIYNNLDMEYGTSNMNDYKIGFKEILEGLLLLLLPPSTHYFFTK